MISIHRIMVVWVEVSGLNLRSLLSTQRLLVRSWKGMCLVDTIDRGSAALHCILMLHLPCLQRDDVIPSTASQYHASRQEMKICNTNQRSLLCVTTYPPRYTRGDRRVFWRSKQVSAAPLCPRPVQQCIPLFNNGNTAKGHLVARQ